MGYQPLNPDSAMAMRRIAKEYRDSLEESHIEPIIKEIKKNALCGSMMLNYYGNINKKDIRNLKELGYEVKKNWFKPGYTIWWCD